MNSNLMLLLVEYFFLQDLQQLLWQELAIPHKDIASHQGTCTKKRAGSMVLHLIEDPRLVILASAQ